MTLRQDETDVNFLDIKPADWDKAFSAMQDEFEANRRAWEKAVWLIAYAKQNYPEDIKLVDGLETIRHCLESRMKG